MNAPQRNRNTQAGQRRPNRPKDSKPVDIWRPVQQLPEVLTIPSPDDPSALVRSLGDLPLPGKGDLAGHYVAAVIERAAAVASALAASVDIHEDTTTGD